MIVSGGEDLNIDKGNNGEVYVLTVDIERAEHAVVTGGQVH